MAAVDKNYLPAIVAVRHLGGHRLRIAFDDGLAGEIDLRRHLGGQLTGIFEPLRDPTYVAQVRLLDDADTLSWPNGADLDPLVLYCAIKGVPVASFD